MTKTTRGVMGWIGSLFLAAALGACAPESQTDTAAEALTLARETVTEGAAVETVAVQYSLAVRGDGTLLAPFVTASPRLLPGAVVFDQSDETQALRAGEAQRFLARSPLTGAYYYDEEARALAQAIVRDLASPMPGLITVRFAEGAEGETVTVTSLAGERWSRTFTATQLRDPGACVRIIVDEVLRQVEAHRATLPR